MEEQILVVTEEAFQEAGKINGISKNFIPFLNAVQRFGMFIPRSEAENDPAFKQVIPYVLVQHIGRVSRFFSYLRGNGMGEERLHGKRSIGLGGHVSRDDGDKPLLAFMEGMVRELREEVDLTYKAIWPVGVIYDSSTPVGKVHLGIVHACRIEEPDVFPVEEDILEPQFLTRKQLAKVKEQYESWSQFCISAMGSSGKPWPPDKREIPK